jgi:hypothetical protein
MKQESPGPSPTQGGSTTISPQAYPHPHAPHGLVCSCATPLHPDHLEKRRGVMVERYTCPRRRWWNAWMHPHAWMEPREGVPK